MLRTLKNIFTSSSQIEVQDKDWKKSKKLVILSHNPVTMKKLASHRENSLLMYSSTQFSHFIEDSFALKLLNIRFESYKTPFEILSRMVNFNETLNLVLSPEDFDQNIPLLKRLAEQEDVFIMFDWSKATEERIYREYQKFCDGIIISDREQFEGEMDTIDFPSSVKQFSGSIFWSRHSWFPGVVETLKR